jgi:hypothetical protein
MTAAEPMRKVYVAPGDGQEVTEEVALAMGYALADQLLAGEAEKPRREDDHRPRRG